MLTLLYGVCIGAYLSLYQVSKQKYELGWTLLYTFGAAALFMFQPSWLVLVGSGPRSGGAGAVELAISGPDLTHVGAIGGAMLLGMLFWFTTHVLKPYAYSFAPALGIAAGMYVVQLIALTVFAVSVG